MAKKGAPAVSATKAEVNALLDVNLEDAAMEGFVFDVEVARRAFDHFDKNKSNELNRAEILKLAEKLWTTFYPQGPGLDSDGRAQLAGEIIRAVDEDGNASISFDEFVPWFKKMNEKFWALTHPKSPEAAQKPRAKQGAAPPAASTSSGANPAQAQASSPPSISVSQSLPNYGSSDIDAPPAKADMEPIRARLEDLRSSIEAFGTMLDMRLDNWLQTIESYGDQIKGTQGSSGIV